MPKAVVHDFSGYRQFSAELHALALAPRVDAGWNKQVDASLDGVAGKELQRLVDLTARRAAGAFFTGSTLAERLVGSLSFGKNAFIYDPTVGAADLLLAAARRLPLGKSLRETLRRWGQCLAGTDLQPEFIEAARLRLALLARQSHGGDQKLPDDLSSFFPHIRCANGLEQKQLLGRATHLLMNPPYGLVPAPADCAWAGGRVSEAAIFIVRLLEQASAGTRLLAILPDVLRSGSFQHRWRERVGDLAKILKVERYGIFDDIADVDVFLLDVCRRSGKKSDSHRWPVAVESADTKTIADFFDVHVGRVVPHRDKETGPLRRYIHPRSIPVWTDVRRIEDKRHHPLAYQPPFVVLRRTSRPGHPYRAAATVILGKAPVAVENHLIVCEPRDKSADTCRALMAQLKTERVNEFLDERIRCRHLTVGAVKEIPVEF
ncbi:MAG TPA: hypothetical protein DIT13_01640 [Verrucomicrobiales bacterium]|nr:hypothetical protein [Verrucomicrobiales bacterium]HRJ07497.1 hypothetical protein [Prosthecobacter sp.]HRK12743.1 hypothetical protein [Prosthecobacter sp.]